MKGGEGFRVWAKRGNAFFASWCPQEKALNERVDRDVLDAQQLELDTEEVSKGEKRRKGRGTLAAVKKKGEKEVQRVRREGGSKGEKRIG